MKVVICDGETRSALSAFRALMQKGVSVTVGSHKKSAMSFHSRDCVDPLVYPNPNKERALFLEYLNAYVRQSAEPVLFMSFTDVTTDVLQMGKRDGTFLGTVVGPSWDNYLRATNKRVLGELAISLGVPTPRVVPVSGTGGQVSIDTAFPVIVKPARSVSWSEKGAYKETAHIAYTQADFDRYYTQFVGKAEHVPLVQELLIGDEFGLSVLARQGEIVALFAHKRLRSITPHGGVSALRESVEVTPEMKDIAQKLVYALTWEGVMMIELKRDESTQRLNLIEINARFWGSLFLAIQAGVHFPYLLFLLASEQLPKETSYPMYQVGVRARHILSDISGMYALGRKAFALKNLLPFFVFFGKDLYYDVWSLRDPFPGIWELYYFIKKKL